MAAASPAGGAPIDCTTTSNAQLHQFKTDYVEISYHAGSEVTSVHSEEGASPGC